MRLIDADALIEWAREDMQMHIDEYQERKSIEQEKKRFLAIKNAVDKAPTIDAVPVVRGHWEDCELVDGKDLVALGYKRCSICHDVGFLNEDAYGYWNGQTLTDFCPTCGAKMDGAE